jgi:hypothetical protein
VRQRTFATHGPVLVDVVTTNQGRTPRNRAPDVAIGALQDVKRPVNARGRIVDIIGFDERSEAVAGAGVPAA